MRSDPRLLILWTEATKRGAGGANNPAGSNQHVKKEVNVDNVNVEVCQSPQRPTGTSAEAGIRSLQKRAAEGNTDAERELAAVLAGEKPAQGGGAIDCAAKQ